MANTYVAIATTTVESGGAADIEFTNIPATYTDLVVKISGRTNGNGSVCMQFNAITSGYSGIRLEGNGSSAYSGSISGQDGSSGNSFFLGGVTNSGQTANTFGSLEVYIPNYAGSNNKSISSDGLNETNATTAYMLFYAGLLSNTAAITSVKIIPYVATDLIVQYSTATLYGIKSS